MKEKMRIENEESWQDDGYWACPYCQTRNELNAWLGDENCSDCLEGQTFETEYVDPYEGIIENKYQGHD